MILSISFPSAVNGFVGFSALRVYSGGDLISPSDWVGPDDAVLYGSSGDLGYELWRLFDGGSSFFSAQAPVDIFWKSSFSSVDALVLTRTSCLLLPSFRLWMMTAEMWLSFLLVMCLFRICLL